jgi:hypothetical protein
MSEAIVYLGDSFQKSSELSNVDYEAMAMEMLQEMVDTDVIYEDQMLRGVTLFWKDAKVAKFFCLIKDEKMRKRYLETMIEDKEPLEF